MHDPRQPDICFQGRDCPREGTRHKSAPPELRLGDLCLAVGNLDDALGYYRAGLARASGDGEARLEIVLKVSSCLRRQGKSEEALSVVEGFCETLEGRERRDLLAEKATLLCLLGRYGEAARVCEQVRLEEPAGERGKDAGIYLVLGHVLSRLCNWKEALVCLEQAATFASMSGDLNALGNAHNNLGIVNKNLCRFDDSARHLRRAVEVARRTHDDASLAVRLLNLATTLLKKGEIAAAEEAASECAKISAALNIVRTRCLAAICAARIARARGRIDEARRIVEGVAAEAKSLDEPRIGMLARETLGEVLCAQGDAAEARKVLARCLEDVPDVARDLEAEVASRLGEACLALGQGSSAKQYAERAVKTAEATGDLYEAGRALRVLAAADPASTESRRLLARAAGSFRAMGARLEYALTLAAKASLDSADNRSSARALERAAMILEACGAHGPRAETLCSLASLHADSDEPDRALAALDDAVTAGDPRTTARAASAVRARVDASISKSLSVEPRDAIRSSEEAFSHLRDRFGASALVIAALDGSAGPRVIAAHGANTDIAVSLLAVALAKKARPLVVSSVRDAAEGIRQELGSMVGVEFGAEPGRWLALVCWPAAIKGTGRPGAARFAEVHAEIRSLGGALEKAVGAVDHTSLSPICVGGILTRDRRMEDILFALPRIARTRASILIVGETGTGKELVASAIHSLSPRRLNPFVAQNCAALPEQLLESELFGHRAGAFTDARTDKRGLLEAASGGSFFLDEIGDVSPAIQAKMLRAIESGEIRRVGDTQARRVDVRFIAATNKRLEDEVERGSFRRDLYYRLNVVSLVLPPLRERKDDVELLARLFLLRYAGQSGRKGIELDDTAVRALRTYSWPGNVRQLENEIERAVAMLGSGRVLTADSLSSCVTGGGRTDFRPSLKDEIRSVEKQRILAVLEKCAWNKTRSAQLLGDLSRPALVAKMKRLGIPLARPGAL